MEDDAIGQILELRQERARLMKALAEQEIEKLIHQRLSWTALQQLKQAREAAMVAQHHLHSEEAGKARGILGKLIEQLTPDAAPTKH